MLKVTLPLTPRFVPWGKRFRIPESRKILLVESGTREIFVLKSGQYTSRNIDWNPESLFHWRSRILNLAQPESKASNPWNPRIFRISLHCVAKASILLYKKREFIFEEINSKAACLVESFSFFNVTWKWLNQGKYLVIYSTTLISIYFQYWKWNSL